MREKNWDKYEVALLIEAFLAIGNGADRLAILQGLSSNLRKMAENEGFDIDDKFRNLNGVQWQLGYIKLIFNETELKNRKAPKLFIDGVQLYKEQRKEYDDILQEAYVKIGQGTEEMTVEDNKKNFIKWLGSFNGKKCAVEPFVEYFEKVSV